MRSKILILAIAAWALVASSAAAASPCVNSMPVDEVAEASGAPDGLPASGLTVSRGTVPEPFEGKVLGVLEDGVAPDVDMIVAELSSPAIERAGGIWAGMSGSPVYAADGRLIGAVAYGLGSGASKIAGLAASEDMERLLELGDTAPPDTVKLSSDLQKKAVETGAVTKTQAAGGLERMALPLSVSGLSDRRVEDLGDRLPGDARLIPHRAGRSGDVPAAIVPGGNLAAAMSKGDVAMAGVGTATVVCDDRVLGFGHPLNFDGPTSLSAHAASAVTVQDDPAGVPFKLANIGGALGTVDQDRLSGIRVLLGDAPAGAPVTSHVSEEGGGERSGTTTVDQQALLAPIGAMHTMANVDRVLDRIGAGSAAVSWTVRGEADGEPFTLTRENRFADDADVSAASTAELGDGLDALIENQFSDVTIGGVSVDARVEPFGAYRVTGLEQQVDDAWEPVDPESGIEARAGDTLHLRVLLAAHQSSDTPEPAPVDVTIPADAAGEGTLDVTGRQGEETEAAEGDEPGSFTELLDSMRDARRNDELTTTLQLADADEPSLTLRSKLPEVVQGALNVPVAVTPADGQE